MADAWIDDCQVWLDSEFGSSPGYLPTPQNGLTGWPTMYSLTRALQITLGISSPSNAFGPTTTTQFQSRVGTIGGGTASSHPRLIGILRTALWCKGYPGGYDALPGSAAFLEWDSALATSVAQVRTDLGLSSTGGVTAKLMKSLLAMDAYKLIPGGSSKVRTVQQWMNGRYFGRRDFPMVPCDGVYSRQAQIGLLYALQYEIGMSDGTANGNFGPGTQQGVRDYGLFAYGSTESTRKMVSLFQAGLILSGQASRPFSGTFDSASRSEMQSLQTFSALSSTNSPNYATWASLLASTGDPDRPVQAADTSTQVTAVRAPTLYSAGHRVVGRYINGAGEKRIAYGEPQDMGQGGLRWFPIYQEWNNASSWFSPNQGRDQGIRIAARARALGLPENTLVFLAVDYE